LLVSGHTVTLVATVLAAAAYEPHAYLNGNSLRTLCKENRTACSMYVGGDLDQ
jgi:hypothetical protein